MNEQTGPVFISVVVPTFRRWERLQVTLAALEAQTYPVQRFEVIVSDDGSRDGTYEELIAFSASSPLQLHVITGPNGGPSVARNRGITEARGQWVAMTDDDCVPEPDWLSSHAAFIAEQPVYSGIGGAVTRYREGVISRYVDWTRVMLPPLAKDGNAGYLVTANALFERALLQRIGGFSESYKWPGGEDPDLSYRAIAAGALLGYNGRAVIRHMHRESIRGTRLMFWHHGIGLGACLNAEEQALRVDLWRVVSKRILPGIRRAFRERSLPEALVFAYLECVRHLAFRQGILAYADIARSGRTSTNL